MSDLQISLLVVGAGVVAAVYLFNVWQQRQFSRRASEAFAREHEDVLLQEPDASASEDVPVERVEPTLHTTPGTSSQRPPRTAVPTPSAMLVDPLIDYVVEVTVPAPTDGKDLHAELLTLAATWGKPVLLAGYDAGSGEWETGAVGSARFLQLRFAMQMSNRAGCVEQSQLTAFCDTVLKWCERHQGEAKCMDVVEAHATAVQLDRFCADVDIAIGINVVTGEGTPFSGTKIRALAEATGLKLEPSGVFHARGELGETRYTLDNHEPMPFVPEQMKTLSTRGITFLLDVPRVADAVRAFDAMLQMAQHFASALGGILVDDNRVTLSDEAIAKIRREVERIVAKMEAGQISAGGTRALRLFS